MSRIIVAIAIACAACSPAREPERAKPAGCKWHIGGGAIGTPRCAANDPSCGPDTAGHGRCLDELGYRPDAARKPVGARSTESCAYDGECMSGACGECVSTRPPPPPLPGAPQIDKGSCMPGVALGPDGKQVVSDGMCGCVDNACQWFK